jgi:hypothetical protein
LVAGKFRQEVFARGGFPKIIQELRWLFSKAVLSAPTKI